MTLNELVDNIINIARNNNIAESEHMSRTQIEKWIAYYRGMLLKQEIDKQSELGEIDEMYVTTIEPIHLDRKEITPGNYLYVGDQELPKLMTFKNRTGIIAIRDMFGNIIQIGSRTKAKFQKYRKATCKDYIAWVKDNKIYVEGDSNTLEYISADVIAEDPAEESACYDPDTEYPVPVHMIPTIVSLILSRELHIQQAEQSDTTNDSKDDMQNKYPVGANYYNRKRSDLA